MKGCFTGQCFSLLLTCNQCESLHFNCNTSLLNLEFNAPIDETTLSSGMIVNQHHDNLATWSHQLRSSRFQQVHAPCPHADHDIRQVFFSLRDDSDDSAMAAVVDVLPIWMNVEGQRMNEGGEARTQAKNYHE